MPAFSPTQLAGDGAGTWQGSAPAPVSGFAIDSRAIRPGEMFVALRTERRDGHDFLAAAAAQGASAALVARFVPGTSLPQLVVPDPLAALQAIAGIHRARFPGPVIGVTGSAGKTSTKDLLAVLLGGDATVLATAGNLNNHLGVPLTLLRLDPAVHRHAVIEAGISGPGEMDVMAALIAPEIAVITMVAAAHLDGLGTVEGVATEKARLAWHRRPGGVAVFPASCLAYPSFRDLTGPQLVAVDAGQPVPALPESVRCVPFAVRHQGIITRLCVTWQGVVEEFDLRRVTTGMAGNAALALATAWQLGCSAEELRARLPQWRPAPLRGEVRRQGDRIIYLDCYNANPASMADAVEAFVGLAPANAPRLFVVGCMEELGADAASWHRRAGEQWPWRPGDRLIVFGTQADEFAAGARASAAAVEMSVNPGPAAAAQVVREFRGAIFLKGSRRYALETLLGDAVPHAPSGPREEVAA